MVQCVHCEVKVKQSRYRPGVAQRVPGSVKVPRLHDNGTGWWSGQPYAPAAFTLQEMLQVLISVRG
jgi:hypothetical protein